MQSGFVVLLLVYLIPSGVGALGGIFIMEILVISKRDQNGVIYLAFQRRYFVKPLRE